jgi:dTDP-4-amino-4,6-dideoxygalactose transaminase
MFSNHFFKSSAKIYLAPPKITRNSIRKIRKSINDVNSMQIGSYNVKFQNQIKDFVGAKYAYASSSGTSALHLCLKAIGLKNSDEILIPTLTFGATAFAASYVGAQITFLDVEKKSWCLDPNLLEDYLKKSQKSYRFPKAVIAVDLYGMPIDYSAILQIAQKYELPLIVDSAESLGSKYNGMNVGGFGFLNVISFNLNKIITTGGSGMILSNNKEIIDKISFLANQSKENYHWFEHNEIGFNYRSSDILSAIGLSQFSKFNEIAKHKKTLQKLYTELLGHTDEIRVQQNYANSDSNFWLTNLYIEDNPDSSQKIETIRRTLHSNDIESRLIFKPLHLHKAFKKSSSFLNGNAHKIFNSSLSLPSGPNLRRKDVYRICDIIRNIKY